MSIATPAHVDVALLEATGIDAERAGAILDDAESRLRALAHDLAELPGQDQPTAAGCARRLDEQDVAADRGPCQTCGHAG
jgi:hypothetical protein